MTINKEKVAQSFADSYKTYDQHAVVQKDLADILLSDIPQQSFPRTLEIGCGTGYLAKELIQLRDIDKLYLNDISKDLCSVAHKRIRAVHNKKTKISILSGDIEELSLPPRLNLIVSSSTLQWIDNLEKSFNQIYKNLTKNGIFIFSIFTKGTMTEIAHLTNKGLHYYSKKELQEMLTQNFSIKQIKEVENRLYFSNIIALFKHIRCTGVGGINNGETRWTHRLMKEFEEQYRKQYGQPEGLPISYKAHCFICEK